MKIVEAIQDILMDGWQAKSTTTATKEEEPPLFLPQNLPEGIPRWVIGDVHPEEP